MRLTAQITRAGLLLMGFAPFLGCAKHTEKSPAAENAQIRRQQAACASPTAYGRLKNAIFDAATAARSIDKTNLDTLADYSAVRMENPVVTGWDASLDVTHCRGHFILEVPPGAEKGLQGQRQLQADLAYTAQPSADGGGLVYRETGAEAIIAKLAAFRISTAAYRPPPAIDVAKNPSDAAEQTPARQPDRSSSSIQSRPAQLPLWAMKEVEASKKPQLPATLTAPPASPHPQNAPIARASTNGPAATVRAFYGALGSGNGSEAASQVIPSKRRGPYSPQAMTRFYGHLAEPIRLTSLTSLPDGRYRVTYRYSTGRAHCNGGAVVRLSNKGGRSLISSIRSLSGC